MDMKKYMKATELRIGNIVCMPYDDAHLKVTKIHEDKVETIFDGFFAEFDKEDALAGLPLNDEILKSFGFKEIDSDEDNKWLKLKTFNHVFDADESTQYEIVYASVHGYKVGFAKYVHQLQNLYFALTGMELTFNP